MKAYALSRFQDAHASNAAKTLGNGAIAVTECGLKLLFDSVLESSEGSELRERFVYAAVVNRDRNCICYVETSAANVPKRMGMKLSKVETVGY